MMDHENDIKQNNIYIYIKALIFVPITKNLVNSIFSLFFPFMKYIFFHFYS